MSPIIDVATKDYERASKLLELANVEYSVPEQNQIEAPSIIIPGRNGFIYVPSLNLDVARERSHYNSNWTEAHQELSQEDSRMLTLPEFREFLKYTKENHPEVYEGIIAVRSPWREWIDAAFEQRDGGLYVLTGNKTKSEKLNGGLIEDRTPGISLESWIKNPTRQGLPRANVKDGNLYYWRPRDGAVAWFDADSDRSSLGCDWDPTDSSAFLGVRAAKPRE